MSGWDILTVDEVEVDAIRIVLGTDRGNLLDEVLHVLPVWHHGGRVIDDEHGVEASQPVETLLVDALEVRHDERMWWERWRLGGRGRWCS